jgi:hypothetical protein
VLEGLTDPDARAIAITENLARLDLTPWEEARAVGQLRDARREAGLPEGVRPVAVAAGRDHSTTGKLLAVADRLTPAVLEAVERDHGGTVSNAYTLPLSALYGAAKADTDAERARLLALYCQPANVPPASDNPAPAATPGGGAALASAPFTLSRPTGRVAFKLAKPLPELTAAEAAAALEALAPVLKALRARARHDTP